ncbi:hypothetical protein TA3x_004738 [Tundrisphaera sp. TA3]|uniref:hypothetical protein n=1 Tax=Tundrisphaera sp. TA3 TaxID=3435775 RepID=UPI003EC076F5
MRLDSITIRTATWVAPGMILIGLAAATSHGDEPGRFGRLFGMGASRSAPDAPAAGGNKGGAAGMASRAPINADPSSFANPAIATPTGPASPPPPRLAPRARNLKPPTEADPIVTRVSLGRSDNGGQFGMFMQVFADGTVIDGEGVHRVSPDALKPVVEAVQSGDLAKAKGHCGGPAGDFIETVHVVTYDRSYGRLRANSFSYSGNTQGCDHAVHQLQTALDALQTKISSSSPSMAQADSAPPAPSVPYAAANSLPTPPLPLTTTP